MTLCGWQYVPHVLPTNRVSAFGLSQTFVSWRESVARNPGKESLVLQGSRIGEGAECSAHPCQVGPSMAMGRSSVHGGGPTGDCASEDEEIACPRGRYLPRVAGSHLVCRSDGMRWLRTTNDRAKDSGIFRLTPGWRRSAERMRSGRTVPAALAGAFPSVEGGTLARMTERGKL